MLNHNLNTVEFFLLVRLLMCKIRHAPKQEYDSLKFTILKF